MVSIAEFLEARVDEDEARASSGWTSLRDTRWETDDYGRNFLTPSAVLAECAAKRAIIAQCREDHEDSMASRDDATEVASMVLYALAAVYAGHPDYQKEWAPRG